LRDAIAGLQNKTVTVQEYVKTINEVTNIQTYAGSHDSRIRDSGGPVRAGEPYLIGLNRRPELFVPRQSGTVVPLPNASTAAGGPSVYNFYLTSYGGAGAGRAILAELSRELGKDITGQLRRG
jgi:hypothetical protein